MSDLMLALIILVIYIAGVFMTAVVLHMVVKIKKLTPFETDEMYGLMFMWPFTLTLCVIIFGGELFISSCERLSNLLVNGRQNKTRINYTPEDLEEVEEFLKQEMAIKR